MKLVVVPLQYFFNSVFYLKKYQAKYQYAVYLFFLLWDHKQWCSGVRALLFVNPEGAQRTKWMRKIKKAVPSLLLKTCGLIGKMIR